MNVKDQTAMLELLIRVYSLEKILTDKKIIDRDELINEINEISKQVAKSVLEQSNYSGNIDDALKSIKSESNNKN